MSKQLKLKDLQAVILWKNSVGDIYGKKYVKNNESINGALIEFIEYGHDGRALQLQPEDKIEIVEAEEFFQEIDPEFVVKE